MFPIVGMQNIKLKKHTFLVRIVETDKMHYFSTLF